VWSEELKSIIEYVPLLNCIQELLELFFQRSGRRGRDRMVVGFTTACAISAYHH